MANGILSFAGGLAQGYMNETKRRDEMERQAKLDGMREQEFELRKRQLEGQISDQDQDRADRKALREDVEAIQPVDGVSLDVGGTLSVNTDAESAAESVRAIQAANESLPEDQRIAVNAAPTQVVGAGEAQKSFLKTPQGITGAKQYADSLNDPAAQVKRYVNKLKAQGKLAEAVKFENDYEDGQQKLYQARLNALTSHGLEMIAQGNFEGLADAYNKHYNDGRTAVFQPGAGGGGAFVIYQGDPSDGKQLGVMQFKDKDEAAKQFYRTMNPTATLQSQLVAEAEANKPYKLSPGEELYSGQTLLTANRSESPTVQAARIRAGEGGSGGKPVLPKISKNEMGETMDEYTGATLKVIPGTPEENPWFGAAKPATPSRKVWVDVNDNPIPGGLNALYPQLPSADGANPAPQAPKTPGATPANAWNDATGEVISNGRVIGKAKSKEEARALLAKQPAAPKNGATNAGERAMAANIAQPMGADPQAIAREIQRATADLQKVSGPASVAALRQYITSLQGQLANIKG